MYYSLSPNVVHNPPLRHSLIQRRWQVAIINWQQNFTKYIITPQAWQDEPPVLFRRSFLSYPVWRTMLNRLRDVSLSTQTLQTREQNKINECDASCF